MHSIVQITSKKVCIIIINIILQWYFDEPRNIFPNIIILKHIYYFKTYHLFLLPKFKYFIMLSTCLYGFHLTRVPSDRFKQGPVSLFEFNKGFVFLYPG